VPVINALSFISVVAPLPTTYAGDRLLTSARAADVDGHAEPGQKGQRGHQHRATDRSRSHTRARANDETRRYL